MSLAVSLSQNPQGQRYAFSQLTRPSGFAGVDGLFRLLPDGTSERGLAILEVQDGAPRMIDAAPRSFATASTLLGGKLEDQPFKHKPAGVRRHEPTAVTGEQSVAL